MAENLGLKIVATVYAVMAALVLLVAGFVGVPVMLGAFDNAWSRAAGLGLTVGGIVGCASLFAVKELIYLVIEIETNTRRAADAAERAAVARQAAG